MTISQRLFHLSMPMFVMGVVTLAVYMITVFSAVSARAQVAVYPNSYVYNDGAVQIVSGTPHPHAGRTFYYTQTNVIPIAPAIAVAPRHKSHFCPPGHFKKGECSRWGHRYGYYND